MNRTWSLIYILFLCTGNQLFAYNPSSPKVQNFKTHQANFVENKGQLADENGRQSPDIKYYIHDRGVNVYCCPGKISFVFTRVEKQTNDQISESLGRRESPFTKGAGGFDDERFESSEPYKTITNRADLVLIGSNPASQILATDQQEYYENYYTIGDADHDIANVHTYKTITYKNIYPNTDIVLHAIPNGLKYEFIVHPNGKISDIQMRWNGLKIMQMTESGGLEYALNLGQMEEEKPISFQGKNIIETNFELNSNRVGFKVSKYNKSKTLIVDPKLDWSTYFCAQNDDTYGNSIISDPKGNTYTTGPTNLNISGLATSGAYITAYGMYYLAKFDRAGKRQWCTYFGYSSINGNFFSGSAVALDHSGNVYLTGLTGYATNLFTSGAYQTDIIGGADDAFLAKFSSSGKLVWSTYFGGENGSSGTCLVIDKDNNVFLGGATSSSTGIATSGAFKTSVSGTNNDDAFLAKFDSVGNLKWATYFGGPMQDEATGLAVDSHNGVYLYGTTNSTSGIATQGTYHVNMSGGRDAFLAKFDLSGQLQWSTYFGGNSSEISFGTAVDGNDNVYINGFTFSRKGIATIGAFQTAFSYNYLASFTSNGSIRWATYYGGDSVHSNGGIAIDGANDIYVVGGVDTPTISAENTKSGGEDGFIARFNPKGFPQWARYFGGPQNDICTSVTTDGYGDVFMTGYTSSTSGVATPGSFQTKYLSWPQDSNGCEAFVAMFKNLAYDAGIDSFVSPDKDYCMDSLPVSLLFKNYGTNEIDSIQIFFSLNGQVHSPIYWFGKLKPDSGTVINFGKFQFIKGSNLLKAWTSRPNGFLDSFPQNDTAESVVYVSTLPTATAGPDTTLCYDETYTMQGAGGITYLWTPAKYLSNDTIPAPKAIVPNTQRYTLYVRNKYGCEDSANVILTVRPKLQVKINPVSSPVCIGSSVSLSAIGSGGDSAHYVFLWPHDSLKGNPVSKKMYQTGWHTVVLTDNCSGLPGLDSVYIDVTPGPKADFTILNRKPYLPDTTFRFQNQSKNASHYLWTFGDSSPSNNLKDPVHIYTDSGTYKITLVAYGICTNDTGYGYIHIFSKYINIFIPDAFSPNGDGINDIFEIKGLGFNDYDFTIYNRWGELMYASPQPSPGGEGARWDGTCKNQPAPGGIYVYMISVTDQFGIKHYFSGNLTLMR